MNQAACTLCTDIPNKSEALAKHLRELHLDYGVMKAEITRLNGEVERLKDTWTLMHELTKAESEVAHLSHRLEQARGALMGFETFYGMDIDKDNPIQVLTHKKGKEARESPTPDVGKRVEAVNKLVEAVKLVMTKGPHSAQDLEDTMKACEDALTAAREAGIV